MRRVPMRSRQGTMDDLIWTLELARRNPIQGEVLLLSGIGDRRMELIRERAEAAGVRVAWTEHLYRMGSAAMGVY